MTFFSREKLKRKKIEVDHSQISCDSKEVQTRLARIENNYEQLDSILADLEAKMASDDRLRAIDESNADDFEQTFGIRRKRKWRPAKAKKKKSKKASAKSPSSNPRKPR